MKAVSLAKHLNQTLKLPGNNLVLIRHGKSISNHAGTLEGWGDSSLTNEGKLAANMLFEHINPFFSKFSGFHSSDLKRAQNTAFISLGFPSTENTIQESNLLREINLGDDEGIHFDSLTDEQKATFNSFEYKAPNGETWFDVKKRMETYIDRLAFPGTHLIFTHGGLMSAFLYHLDPKLEIGNCCCIGCSVEENQAKKILFKWDLNSFHDFGRLSFEKFIPYD